MRNVWGGRGSRAALILIAIATVIAASLVTAESAAAAPPPLNFEAVSSECDLSWQDTDPATAIAYAIVETTGTDSCELTLQDSASVTIADVTVTNVPAVVYFAAADDYSYELQDLTTFSAALGTLPITGAPAVPAMPAGSASAAGCVVGLEQRTVLGQLQNYSTGWNVDDRTTAANCAHTVTSSTANPAVYSATVNTDTVQIAVPDPFGISLAKSVQTLGGAPITAAVVGQTVRYRFTVTNTQFVPWTVTVNDTHPGLSAVACPPGALAAGASETCTATYVVTNADLTAGTVANSATVTGTDGTRVDATSADVVSNVATASFPVAAVTPAAPSGGGASGAGLARTGTDASSPAAVAILLGLIGIGMIAYARRRRA